MNVQLIPISEIKVGARRRDDFGDLEGLAESIRKYKLFHPIIVDGERNLIAGERRLRAFQLNDESEIPCRLYGELSDDERSEIELEENLQRKDLTPFEANKRLLQTAEKIAEIISSQNEEINSEPEKTETRGRKSDFAAPKKDIAQALGVSTGKLVEAKQHVAAVEKHADLKTATPKEAITTAKEREQSHSGKPSNLKSIKAPIPKPSKRSPAQPIQEFIYSVKQRGGALSFTGKMTQQEQFNFLDDLRSCRADLDDFIAELQDYFDDVRETA
jgi:ParB-like chromosome segregation protein Spo0J